MPEKNHARRHPILIATEALPTDSCMELAHPFQTFKIVFCKVLTTASFVNLQELAKKSLPEQPRASESEVNQRKGPAIEAETMAPGPACSDRPYPADQVSKWHDAVLADASMSNPSKEPRGQEAFSA